MSLIPFVGALQKFNRQRGGYQIERSLRFNSADSAYLSKTFGDTGDQQKWTWSCWVKGYFVRASGSFSLFEVTDGGGGILTGIRFNATGNFEYLCQGSGLGTGNLITSAVYRDPSAWYHLVVAVDTTQATAANRIKMYVNGVQVTAFGTETYQNQNTNTLVGTTSYAHIIGKIPYASVYYNGYMTEVHFVNAQQLSPTDFGEYNSTTGVWQPIAYEGTYDTNGFYLNFSDNSTTDALGTDFSGNDNTWDDNGISVTAGVDNDSLVDTPTNYGTDTGVGGEVRGNYCTWNPLDKNTNLNTVNGNLDVSASNGAWIAAGSTAALAGKIYAETTWTTAGNGFSAQFGLRQSDLSNISAVNPTDTATAWSAYWDSAGTRGTRTNSSITNNVGSAAVNDVYQVAFDADTGNLWLGYNNNWHGGGNPSTGTSPTYSGLTNAAGYRFFCATNFGTTTGVFVSNWGQRPFAYTAPSGFKALCTQNLTEPTIVDGGEYFNTVLWTGDGSSPISIPGVGFQPDWVWGKKTTGASYLSHQLYDAVRGVGSGKDLVSDTTQAEGPNSPAFGSVSSLNVDGFTLTAGSSNNDQLNGSGSTYVAWNWKANGAGVTNTDGLITSTVSANPDAGFSIVTYTGTGVAATIGHGLGAKPSFFIIKKRTNSGTEYGWYCYSSVLGATNHLVLNTTAGSSSSSFLFNDIEPSSSAPYVFTVGTSPATNEISINYVAYCFAAIPGYSAFGSYTGNNAPDGTFVYTGFRPAFLLIKNTSSGTDWCIYDNKRLGYNVDNNLQRNVAAVQQTDDDIDLLSNGFKFRRASANFNGSSSTHIFMAFAENPFKYSLAR
jgi:hypothetical protein